MTEPTQARRYLTRARARADDNPVDVKLPYQWKGREAAQKRKAIAVADTEPFDIAATATSGIRVSRRTVAPKMADEIVGVKAAPKRKSARNGGGTAKRTVTTKSSAATKKVTFSDDKENVVPPRREEAAARQEGDDTDELMSSSMGALSVKPLRVPSTKLRLPSTGKNATPGFDPLPALSPSKARRPPRPLITDDEEMEDELSGPMSPTLKLAARPKRGELSSSRGLMETTGAMDLRKPLNLSASLLASPARRPPASPFKPTTANTTFSKANADAPNAAVRSSLASPARRPPSAAISGLGSPTKGSFRLESNANLTMEIPDLSRRGVKSPPKRIKISSFVKNDESEDELGMDMDNYMLGRSPTRFVKKCAGVSVDRANINSRLDGTTLGDIPKLSAFSSTSVLPIADLPGAQKRREGVGMGEDDTMEDVGCVGHMINQMSPTAKKYKGPTEGGSSYVFFDLEDDEENEQSNHPPYARNPFSPFPGMELQPGRKKLFPSASTSKQLEDGVPIDPFLLTLGAPDSFLGIIESPSRKTTVPVKLHSVDDMVSDEEDCSNQENQGLSNRLVTPTRNDSDRSVGRFGSVGRTSGVLAGAVVFVDVYTSEGADASAAFVEALRGLGAKVLKSWNWNPNSTGSAEGERKVGITHVVFKDGSPRTLQKLKDSQGVVLCVGVGWVTSCEEEQAWVDESIYPVDLDHVPRGGHRVGQSYMPLEFGVYVLTFPQRRKSMEPKTLTGMSANNYCSSSISDNTAISSAPPKTPKLVSKRLFFPQTEQLRKQEVDSNPLLMQNLLMARRKSTQFAPKVGSPLRRFAALTIE